MAICYRGVGKWHKDQYKILFLYTNSENSKSETIPFIITSKIDSGINITKYG